MNSPDYSMWESIFSDHLDNDFMICSPVRNNNNNINMQPLLPQGSNYNYNNNYYMGVGQGGLVVCSPPRFSSPLGPHKGKGLSPLHRVFNSPSNQLMHMENVDSLSLPALESLLDDDTTYDDDKDGDFALFSPMKMVPELLDCLTMPESTRFCHSQESGVYHQQAVGPVAPQPLSQQLQQERQQEEQQEQLLELPIRIHQRQPQQQQQQHQTQVQTMHNTLMVPSLAPEQVMIITKMIFIKNYKSKLSLFLMIMNE